MRYIENVVIGNLLCAIPNLFADNEENWNTIEKDKTLFTTERFLPKIMIECGLVSSIAEVRRNKPELIKTLDSVDFLEIKWGKRKLFIGVGL